MTILPRLRFLLMAPLIVLPFLCLIFHVLGGGQGDQKNNAASVLGLNTQLPMARMDTRRILLDKMKAYLTADQDSFRKHQSEQSDPYHPYIVSKRDSLHKDSVHLPVFVRPTVKADPKADELLQQLDRLKQSMRQQPPPPSAPVRAVITPPITFLPPVRHADTTTGDPQLDRLNTMLDKVIRIQHPGEGRPVIATSGSDNTDEVLPADSASNAIAAVIPTNQTLMSGGALSLRLSQDVLIHGISIPRGQWVYGTVTISNDRMLVHIRTLCVGRNLCNTDLQVYDLDGLPGIHIPDILSQDVAKQSADEGVNGLNLSTYDPSLGAQAANAGIQAGKALFGRKVRLVRVSVKAGYQVLLRNTRPVILKPAHAPASLKDSFFNSEVNVQPPGFVPGGSFLRRCRMEGTEVDLKGIYLQDSLLWIALRWTNHSPIGYRADYCRWLIRDRHSFKRTAHQELTVEPVHSPGLTTIGGDSVVNQWTGFRPFALAKDKELVLEVGERDGGRTLELVIHHEELLKAKKYETESSRHQN